MLKIIESVVSHGHDINPTSEGSSHIHHCKISKAAMHWCSLE